MVVAEQEENIQSVAGSIVDHVKQILGVHSVAVIMGTHTVMQLHMGHDKDGLGVAGAALCVQIGTQVGGSGFDGGFIHAGVPHIVLLVDDKDTVALRLMGAAGSEGSVGGLLVHVVIALEEEFVIVAEGGKLLVDHILQVGYAFLGGGSGEGLRIVAAEQKSVIALKALVFDGCQDIPHMTAGNAVV